MTTICELTWAAESWLACPPAHLNRYYHPVGWGPYNCDAHAWRATSFTSTPHARGRSDPFGPRGDAGTAGERNPKCCSILRSAGDLQVPGRRPSQDPPAALCRSRGDPRGLLQGPAAGIGHPLSPLGVRCLTHLRQILPLIPACAAVCACGLEDQSHPHCVDTEFAVLCPMPLPLHTTTFG